MIDRRSALAGAGGLLAVSTMNASLVGTARAAEPQVPTTNSLTATLAKHAAATNWSRLPPEVQDKARKVLFDEMACACFGRKSPGGTLAASYAGKMGGAAEARIYGTDLRVPAAYAAMANGTAGHGDEVDGTHVVGGHPGASIVHASTALVEKQNASGAELLNAVVLGYDVGVRMVEACGGKFKVRDRKHLTSDFLYTLGTTAASARILRLTPGQIGHAFALATFQANGLYALYDERNHISKSFCNGQYAFAGISSALMAEVGLEGNDDIIGAPEGLIDAWGEQGLREKAVQDLGSTFKIMGGNFKFYNAGYPINAPIEAAMRLVRENRIAPAAIASISIGMPKNAMMVVDERDMANISVQNMVAAHIASGGLSLSDMPFPRILSDPVYRHVRSTVTVAVDPEIDREFPNGRGARVTIATRDGARHSLRIDNPRGHSLRGPVSWDDLLEKWRPSLPEYDIARAIEIAGRAEKLENAATLFDAFALARQ